MIANLSTLHLRWYIDPGHGWLAVPVRALLDSGISGQVSTCSYIDGAMALVYLEEDVDAPLFLAAIGVSNELAATFPVEHLENEGQCFIRRELSSYDPALTARKG